MSMTKGQAKLLAAFAGTRKRNGITRKEAVAEARIKAQGSGPMVKGLASQGLIVSTIAVDGEVMYKATPEGRKALKKAGKK